jgi:hypothetical protein
MAKYTEAQLQIVAFDAEDVITTSGTNNEQAPTDKFGNDEL